MSDAARIPRRIEGQVALVTGGAKRLGQAISLALAREGCHVAVHYNRSRDEAVATAGEVAGCGVKSWCFQADLADTAQVDALFDQAAAETGGIDLLINSASIFPSDRLNDLTPESVRLNVDVNALAPARLARHFYHQGRPGSIVNLLDTRMVDYDEAHVAYHLSKRMLFALTRMQALDYAPSVRVNAVAPGLVLPPEGQTDQYLRDLAHTNPLHGHGDATDVSDAVVYLVTSRFVTGQVLYVDGGRHMMGNVYGC